MEIKQINSTKYQQVNDKNNLQKSNIQQQEKNTKTEAKLKIQDQIQISKEARNLQSIQRKIETGFYNKPEVIERSARQIYIRNFKT
ncbi:MAG: hypothetical protein ACUVQ1_02960 [Candidatus Kapaibacteriales bacterium]